jgi:hypothetical protein
MYEEFDNKYLLLMRDNLVIPPCNFCIFDDAENDECASPKEAPLCGLYGYYIEIDD